MATFSDTKLGNREVAWSPSSLAPASDLGETVRTYNYREAAAALRISKSLLEKLVARGEITYRRIEGRVVFTSSDLPEFPERKRQPLIQG